MSVLRDFKTPYLWNSFCVPSLCLRFDIRDMINIEIFVILHSHITLQLRRVEYLKFTSAMLQEFLDCLTQLLYMCACMRL